MFLFISSFIFIIFILFLWMLLIASSKFKSDEEKFIEDNYTYKINDDEVLYLVLHINRVISVINFKNKEFVG